MMIYDLTIDDLTIDDLTIDIVSSVGPASWETDLIFAAWADA